VTEKRRRAEPLPGFKDVQPDGVLGHLPGGLGRLREPARRAREAAPQRRAFTFEPETSAALGFGFRCGFLGLLHMEIVQERLEREFDLDLITTAPTVVYQVTTEGRLGARDRTTRPTARRGEIESIERAVSSRTIHVPEEYVGAVLKLCEERRGIQTG
jgi:GTP-binding protein LepA